MIRKRLIPQSTNIQVTVPDDYVGKTVEVIVFSEEEEMKSNTPSDGKPGGIAELKGKLNLSKERYEEFQQYLKDIRNEWEREY
ncbi:MAG TPA: hypothetical protein VM368_04120 [Flavisolibacter sp.]|nr:hypothetical protein [Flavisolibacter sp.]